MEKIHYKKEKQIFSRIDVTASHSLSILMSMTKNFNDQCPLILMNMKRKKPNDPCKMHEF